MKREPVSYTHLDVYKRQHGVSDGNQRRISAVSAETVYAQV